MIILDTSVWIEFLRGNHPVFDQVSALFEENEIAAISPIFGELLQSAANAKERSMIMEFWDNIVKIPEADLFIHAGLESGTNKWMDMGVGLIDGAILIAARETSSFVWTLDSKLLRLLRREERYIPC